jgi:hypothetical protein
MRYLSQPQQVPSDGPAGIGDRNLVSQDSCARVTALKEEHLEHGIPPAAGRSAVEP